VINKLIFPILLLTASSAFADFNFTLSNATQSTPPGGIFDPTCQSGSSMCLIFQGTIDTVTADTFFTGIDVEFTPPTAFLSNNELFFGFFGPFFVAAGDTYNGPIFEIDIDPVNPGDPTAPFGPYPGTVQLIGGPDPFDPPPGPLESPIIFEVDVVPEPSTWVLMLIGLSSVAFLARKRRRAAVRV
jgi:PEP-CTERM motif